ncbi:phosphonate ABC transporter ATP-binding protein [Undibacterium curvum]|uniref:phosphonate ABC transporter ATP-binding protein n=1 Tax=Undibacterium curvum TaxID=2762294 RepID=UPI003D0F4577
MSVTPVSNAAPATQISLRDLCVQHAGAAASKSDAGQNFALKNISLQIKSGEQIAIIGPSGAGKTTLLHTLACAHQPASGELVWNDSYPWQHTDAERHAMRRQLFLAPQSPPLPARQRVITSVLAGRLPQWSLWQSLRSLFSPSDPVAAYEALAHFHLQDKLYARVDQLSGGERQRCGLARLCLSDARLLLVDEPLSALDPTLAVQTLNSLQQLARQRQATLICSLHQVELARQHFPRVIGLRQGEIVFDTDRVTDTMLTELYRNAGSTSAPAHLVTAAAPDTALPDTMRCF